MRRETYDYTPPSSGGGNFVALKQKGDFAKVLILDGPMVFSETRTNEKTNQEQTREKFWFLVVDYSEVKSEADLDKRKIKILDAGPGMYSEICKFARDPDWGTIEDAGLNGARRPDYFVKITRSEVSPSKYYDVVALGKVRGPVPDKDLELLTDFTKEHDVPFEKLLEHLYEKVKNAGNSESPAGGGEYNPFEDE